MLLRTPIHVRPGSCNLSAHSPLRHTFTSRRPCILLKAAGYAKLQSICARVTGADVQVLGNNLTRRLHANLLGPHPQSGAFLDSCWHHCGGWNRIRIDGDLVSVALQKWYDSLGKAADKRPKKRLWNQGKPYKCDACCSPDG